MSIDGQISQTVVVCEKDGDCADLVRRYLEERHFGEVRWYAPRDLNDVDRQVCAGAAQRVVFGQPSDFLEGVWNGVLDFDCWQAAGADILFADETTRDDAAWLTAIAGSWKRYRQRTRNARMIAGLVLSVVAVAAAFVVILAAG